MGSHFPISFYAIKSKNNNHYIKKYNHFMMNEGIVNTRRSEGLWQMKKFFQ
jgi:hypothetical protein